MMEYQCLGAVFWGENNVAVIYNLELRGGRAFYLPPRRSFPQITGTDMQLPPKVISYGFTFFLQMHVRRQRELTSA